MATASVRVKLHRILPELIGPAALTFLMVLMLRHTLFSGGTLAPAWPGTDLFSEYMPWRYFAFRQWSHGQFPGWDPHIFCGLPFFAQIQSCLFYPIAWVNFLFNVATATTLESVLNLSAGAMCMYAWARSRGISRCGSTLAGLAFPLSAPIYPHILDGYLTVLSSAAWMPLIFLGLDRLLAKRFLSGILLGSIAVCLECLAGHAQLVYYTFLIAGLYVLLFGSGKPRALRVFMAFTAMWLLGGMLAALQLLPTYFANQLSVRAGGVSYAYASMISLPPENLLTILIPYPLGGTTGVPYLGRWLLWETSLYVGLLIVVLSCFGLADVQRSTRWRFIALLGIILILILGNHTPLHWLLYEYLPGFGLFRDPAKFNVLWALLLAMLAGHGWDRVHRNVMGRRHIWFTAAAAGFCILFAAIVYHFDTAAGPVAHLLRFVYRTRAFVAPERYFDNPLIYQSTAYRMAIQWAIAGTLLAALSLLISLRRYSVRYAYFLLILAAAEVYFAAAACNVETPVQQPFPQQWTTPVIKAMQYDQRVLFGNGVTYSDMGDSLGYDSVWGYGPGQPMRFTKLIAVSQGQHPIWADQYPFEIGRPSRIFQLLRCRYLLQWSGKYPALEFRDPMPHLQLIGNWTAMIGETAIEDQLTSVFDFRHSAILSTTPSPLPVAAGVAGNARLIGQTINDLEIEADLPAPALLLITDAYAPGWRVRPLETRPPQSDYEVLQADDVLRAIPLSAGHHHFDLYYTPPGLAAGIGISIAAAALWLIGMAVLRIRRPLPDALP